MRCQLLLELLLILFVDVSLMNFGAGKRVQRDEAILSQRIPVMMREAACLDTGCSRGFVCLALSVALSRQSGGEEKSSSLHVRM